MVFITARDNVINPRNLKTKLCEYMLGDYRHIRREYVAQELIEIQIKRKNKKDAIIAIRLRASHDTQKGRTITFESFVDSSVPDYPTADRISVNSITGTATNLCG